MSQIKKQGVLMPFVIFLFITAILPKQIHAQDSETPVYFTINIHIEPGVFINGAYCNDPVFFSNGVEILDSLMVAAESIGAKLSVFTEYPFLYGAINFQGEGNNIITELIARGHSVGLHSHFTSNLFSQGADNLCGDATFPEVTEDNYVDHFEYIWAKVLGKQNIYEDVQSAYGAHGPTIIDELASKGIQAIYLEFCSYPDAGNPLYCYEVGYRGSSLADCPSITNQPPLNNLLQIPTTNPYAYLSSRYARARITDSACVTPVLLDTALCGNWYQEDFDMVYSTVNKAVYSPKDSNAVNTIGMVFHIHNFNDESKSYCGFTSMDPDYDELALFKNWLQTDIASLHETGLLKFANSNELIAMAKGGSIFTIGGDNKSQRGLAETKLSQSVQSFNDNHL
ncbi:MAG: hypothetical protein GWP19_15710 [Planctomycetia bacterium]|nr:hypothetical protein [Planctomycetia bacterium]